LTYTAIARGSNVVPISCTTTTNGCQLAGLVNGHQYVVVVTDNNGTVDSAPAFSNHFFAGTVPSAPTTLRASSSQHVVRVSWKQAVSPVGEPVLRYEIQATSGTQLTTRLVGADATECRIGSLAANSTYTIRVSAYDRVGWSTAAVITITTR
jgi:hypothetical protein